MVQELKDHYQRGGLGDVKIKNILFEILEQLLAPIRQKRSIYEQDKAQPWHRLTQPYLERLDNPCLKLPRLELCPAHKSSAFDESKRAGFDLSRKWVERERARSEKNYTQISRF
jgi:tryptophanyl-tRNA synthetase